eukprot:s185_g1.t3
MDIQRRPGLLQAGRLPPRTAEHQQKRRLRAPTEIWAQPDPLLRWVFKRRLPLQRQVAQSRRRSQNQRRNQRRFPSTKTCCRSHTACYVIRSSPKTATRTVVDASWVGSALMIPGSANSMKKMPPTLLAPMTQLPLTSRTLQPNIALKQAVEAFRSERPAEEARERERRQLLQKVEEAKAAEGDLKSNFNQELEALHGKMQDLQDQLGQANVDLQAAKEEAVKLQEKAEVCAGDDFDDLEYELAQLESEFGKESAEELGLVRLPYHTEIPGQRPSIGRSEGLGACAMFYQRTLSTPGLLFKETSHQRQCCDRMLSCATETDCIISAMKTEEQSLVPGSSNDIQTLATPAGGQLAPLVPGKAPKRRQASRRVSWAQFRASKLPQIKADLERQWEMLMADAEARDLLTMRYDSASPHAALVQFREELDRMIVERTQTLERGAAASEPATRAPRSSRSDVPPPSALL